MGQYIRIMNMKRLIRYLRSFLILLSVMSSVGLLLAGCGDDMNAKSHRAKKAHLVELVTAHHAPLLYAAGRAGSLRALRQVKLFNQEEGQVENVLVREGDSVRKGQILARLDTRLLQAQLDKAVAYRKQAANELDRIKPLAPKKLVSENAILRAQTALDIARAEERILRARVGYMNIRAPFAGKIAARHVESGDIAPKHTHLLTVVDPTQLVTDVQISELLISRLQLGDRAEVRIDALGESIYNGKIIRIYPTIDPSTRLGRIEVALNPVPKGARPGQFCRVTLYQANTQPLVVPLAALRRDTLGEFVYVLNNESKAQRISVISGLQFERSVEIRSGLKAGQRVVTKGFLGLTDGKAIRAVDSGQKKKITPQTNEEKA